MVMEFNREVIFFLHEFLRKINTKIMTKKLGTFV